MVPSWCYVLGGTVAKPIEMDQIKLMFFVSLSLLNLRVEPKCRNKVKKLSRYTLYMMTQSCATNFILIPLYSSMSMFIVDCRSLSYFGVLFHAAVAHLNVYLKSELQSISRAAFCFEWIQSNQWTWKFEFKLLKLYIVCDYGEIL